MKTPVPPRRPLSEQAAVHDQVYARLRDALIAGRIAPGRALSLRSLAAELGVSPMPVRDAVRRLAAERALVVNPANKRLSVPRLEPDRLEQVALARGWIEPELAARAARRADPALIAALITADAALDKAMSEGDMDGYMQANRTFHFTLYRAAGAEVLLNMAETLWLQVGPFMRLVFERLGTMALPADRHQEAIHALQAADSEAARRAIAADIAEGMEAMRQSENGA
ncbi:DNA-binding GntR family transcriptional regulator [Caulobacter ginsengisoli]|jgi:DNA-binding GntR family transcriptional regulator|uniref:DNA-binding GntR family transcriptional regulator n=1 Tax=Caulobacter ginsengisoli TaxID=400775 RepID=A0ABU0IQH8_9CAUL|nr:GntR family transcriptional regulator [Caulobacter ginsengisoli]MDQ0464272.1 DNA-binding GntR family transcriptional regulator [Caulobacter ginsengisoli]